jgi:hypothetical protein
MIHDPKPIMENVDLRALLFTTELRTWKKANKNMQSSGVKLKKIISHKMRFPGQVVGGTYPLLVRPGWDQGVLELVIRLNILLPVPFDFDIAPNSMLLLCFRGVT